MNDFLFVNSAAYIVLITKTFGISLIWYIVFTTSFIGDPILLKKSYKFLKSFQKNKAHKANDASYWWNDWVMTRLYETVDFV